MCLSPGLYICVYLDNFINKMINKIPIWRENSRHEFVILGAIVNFSLYRGFHCGHYLHGFNNLFAFLDIPIHYLRYLCLFVYIVVSNTYCIVVLFCFSSSCVAYDASFSGLFMFDCLFCIL